ncbi:Alpha/Beta hydrolase protein [Desarmillaria tabescens]|uniref:Alpha/Beta hydrolase protein n=1 Tax=Armillaria tabescens TaxID=1929756 RepID=A0AA39N8X2_ARMTA|nr:Alpha/Beta hydrolase protein [Desarmillaria tabescens]KAK0461179.1 Alpha/Beta hydrolase protein [Desarmillaria tabescens]
MSKDQPAALYSYSGQPAKQIYLAYQLFTTIFFRLPIWFFLAVPKSLRPRPTWPLKRVLFLRLFRHFMYITSQTGPIYVTPNHLAITPGVGIEGVWIPPANKFMTKSLKSMADVSKVLPTRIPGYWVHRKGSNIEFGSSPTAGEKVVLSFHGGAYIRYSAHPDDPTATIAKGLLKNVASVQRLFCVEYRLSKTSAGAFPAALLDALAAYVYLVNDIGFLPTDIIIEGDSAGGNLALALTRYLVESQNNAEGLPVPPPPSALVLFSPWADIGTSHFTLGSIAAKNSMTDYIGGMAESDYARKMFCGQNGKDAISVNPYMSPASIDPRMKVDFKGFPRTFIVAGGAEVLLGVIRTLKERMVRDLGENKMGYYEAAEGIHDYVAFTEWEPERRETYKAVAEWLANPVQARL